MAYRITARVPDDLNARLDEWSVKLGVTKSQLAGMSIQAGFDAILRAVSPVDSISAEQLAKVVKAMEGLDEKKLVEAKGKETKS